MLSRFSSHDRLAAVLLLIFLIQLFAASASKSPTSDERPHVAAGLSYLANRSIELNPEHPPLLKQISALSLMLSGVRWPDRLTAYYRSAPAQDLQWFTGDTIFTDNGPQRVAFYSRLPFILLATAFGLLIYYWGSQLLSPPAALGALVLYTCDPNILAHAYLVTTDLGFGAFTFLFLFALYHFLRQPSPRRLALAGIALGAAMCTKFSGIALPPIAAILLFAAQRFPLAKPQSPNPAWARPHFAFLILCAIAFTIIQTLYFFPANPFTYFLNYTRLYPFDNPEYNHLLAGQFQRHFYSYLPTAFLLKEPLPVIALIALGLPALLRRPTPISTRLFLLIPAAILTAGYIANAKNIGYRYLLPVLPFLFLAAGLALSRLLAASATRRYAGIALLAWIFSNAAGIYPDHLSFFNESACLLDNPSQLSLAAGTNCGTAWLDDSNVDWGQSMLQLKAWLDQHAPNQPVRLANFTGLPPESYGIQYIPIDFDRELFAPLPATYVVSAHYVARMRAFLAANPGASSWITRPPDAAPGHAYYIYIVR